MSEWDLPFDKPRTEREAGAGSAEAEARGHVEPEVMSPCT